MPSKKQRRRREKLKRHEWEEVYVDEEGNELDPEEAEAIVGTRSDRRAARAQAQPERGGRKPMEPPSWRRTLRRGALFFPLMLVTVFLLAADDATTAQKITQTFVLMAFFLPFSYFMDSMVWRSFQRRVARGDEPKKR